MDQTRMKDTVSTMALIPLEEAKCLGGKGTPCASSFAGREEDLIPYYAKDLKYLWTLWDEAQRHRQARLTYKTIYLGAGVVILVGWGISWMGQSFFLTLGHLLMIAGGLIGSWCCLKSLRQKKASDLG